MKSSVSSSNEHELSHVSSRLFSVVVSSFAPIRTSSKYIVIRELLQKKKSGRVLGRGLRKSGVNLSGFWAACTGRRRVFASAAVCS
jgi:hypothetical protein